MTGTEDLWIIGKAFNKTDIKESEFKYIIAKHTIDSADASIINFHLGTIEIYMKAKHKKEGIYLGAGKNLALAGEELKKINNSAARSWVYYTGLVYSVSENVEAFGELYVYNFLPCTSGKILISRGRSGYQAERAIINHLFNEMGLSKQYISAPAIEELTKRIEIKNYMGRETSIEGAISYWEQRGRNTIDLGTGDWYKQSQMIEAHGLLQNPMAHLIGFEECGAPPITMPNGQSGYVCIGHCGEFFSYVEPNRATGYICPSCR